jgi:metal-responsive CopG/Arc/MetJ family transcriptional regulator
MKVKTSVTLNADLLTRVDDVLHANESRSAFFHQAIARLAEQREKELRDARDLELINQQSDYLNQEAQDNFMFVASLSEDI